MLRKFILPVIFICFLFFLVNLFVCKVPPDAITRTNMTRLEVRISNYYSENATLPNTLDDLPPDSPMYGESLKDGWGYTIQYKVNDGIVTLLSLGKDSSPGGKGMNKDISTSFNLVELKEN